MGLKVSNQEVEEERDEEGKGLDYAKRAQWVRAGVLGASDGLVSTAALMMGVGGVERDDQSMILSGVAGLVAGACSMAIGEFVSVSSQYDIELAQLKREGNMDQKHKLPNPYSAAFASALAFSLGAGVPLLASASVSSHRIRMAVLAGVVTLTLIVFGALSGCLGKVSRVKFICRILIGGWMAMAVTFGLTKLVNDFGILLT